MPPLIDPTVGQKRGRAADKGLTAAWHNPSCVGSHELDGTVREDVVPPPGIDVNVEVRCDAFNLVPEIARETGMMNQEDIRQMSPHPPASDMVPK